MGSIYCFFKTFADVFPPWHYVNIYLNGPDQEVSTSKTSYFIEVSELTPTYN